MFLHRQRRQRMVNTLRMIKTPAAGFPAGVENMGGRAPHNLMREGGLSENMEGA